MEHLTIRRLAVVLVVLSGALLLWRSTPPPRQQSVPSWGERTLLDVAMARSQRFGDPTPLSIRYVTSTWGEAAAYLGSHGFMLQAPPDVSERTPVHVVVARGMYQEPATPEGEASLSSLVSLVSAQGGMPLADLRSPSDFTDLGTLGEVIVIHFVPGGR